MGMRVRVRVDVRARMGCMSTLLLKVYMNLVQDFNAQNRFK